MKDDTEYTKKREKKRKTRGIKEGEEELRGIKGKREYRRDVKLIVRL